LGIGSRVLGYRIPSGVQAGPALVFAFRPKAIKSIPIRTNDTVNNKKVGKDLYVRKKMVKAMPPRMKMHPPMSGLDQAMINVRMRMSAGIE
jgi:hypothetical protein